MIVSYSGQLDAVLSPRWRWPTQREVIRADVVFAVRANASIARNDADGRRGWCTCVRSDPVHLPSWGKPGVALK